MHNFDVGSGSSSPFAAVTGSRGVSGSDGSGHSVLSLVLLIAAVAIVAVLALTAVFWALGLVFSVFGWILRIAIVTAVAAFVWKRITRGRRCHSDHI